MMGRGRSSTVRGGREAKVLRRLGSLMLLKLFQVDFSSPLFFLVLLVAKALINQSPRVLL